MKHFFRFCRAILTDLIFFGGLSLVIGTVYYAVYLYACFTFPKIPPPWIYLVSSILLIVLGFTFVYVAYTWSDTKTPKKKG